MRATRYKFCWWFILIIVGLVLFAYFVRLGIGEYYLARMKVRETTATVKWKERIKFDEVNPFYMDELGNKTPVQLGDEHWRVYYQIDRFNGLEESVQTRLIEEEKERASTNKLRFSCQTKDWYDNLEVGDKLKIFYQWHGDSKIEIVIVQNPKYLAPQ